MKTVCEYEKIFVDDCAHFDELRKFVAAGDRFKSGGTTGMPRDVSTIQTLLPRPNVSAVHALARFMEQRHFHIVIIGRPL